MSEFVPLSDSLAAVERRVERHRRPYQTITAISALWNEAARAPKLLRRLKRNFAAIRVIVQESTDGTLEICRSILDRPSDRVGEHPHYGYGDASYPELAKMVDTDWAFMVSGDEWPDDKLLRTLGVAVAEAERQQMDCVWVKLDQELEGIFIPEQSYHSRVFRPRVGWPGLLHSRPGSDKGIGWPHGSIIHSRSLDEMMTDYLSYFEVGRGNAGWEAHNRLMMHDACAAVAARYGWEQVTAHEWWPQVKAIAFAGEETP